MTLYQLDKAINDLMEKVDLGDGTDQEIQFLKNLYQDLGEMMLNLPNVGRDAGSGYQPR